MKAQHPTAVSGLYRQPSANSSQYMFHSDSDLRLDAQGAFTRSVNRRARVPPNVLTIAGEGARSGPPVARRSRDRADAGGSRAPGEQCAEASSGSPEEFAGGEGRVQRDLSRGSGFIGFGG